MFLQNLSISILFFIGLLLIISGFKINQKNVADYLDAAANTDAGPWVALLTFLLKGLRARNYGRIAFIISGGVLSLTSLLLLLFLNR